MQKSTASPKGEELFFQVNFFFFLSSKVLHQERCDRQRTLQSRQQGTPEMVKERGGVESGRLSAGR